jgi:hypothetical protein
LFHDKDIARALWELQITIQKLKATTTPDGKALNIYYLTDTRFELLKHPL